MPIARGHVVCSLELVNPEATGVANSIQYREMAVGNTFGATALSSYGGFWIGTAIILTPGGFQIEASVAQAGGAAAFADEFGFYLIVNYSIISPEKLLLMYPRAGSSLPSSSSSARSAPPSPSSASSFLSTWHSCSSESAICTVRLGPARLKRRLSRLEASLPYWLPFWRGIMPLLVLRTIRTGLFFFSRSRVERGLICGIVSSLFQWLISLGLILDELDVRITRPLFEVYNNIHITTLMESGGGPERFCKFS